MTHCNTKRILLHANGSRDLVARFDGGRISSDAGGVLLLEAERKTGIIRQLADCFTDHREANRTEHSVYDLIAQRIYGLGLGHEDLNDHDTLRHDPLLAVLVGKDDPTGADRSRERDKNKPLAGKSTLNRLELTPPGADAESRYKKIVASCASIENLFVKLFMDAHATPPERIMLDLDATDDRVHGKQAGRFFHGYYGDYCFLPLYIFCGEHLLCAALRPSDIDASAGSTGHLERIIKLIRTQWPAVKITVRGDSGFCRDHIMNWCENNSVDYIFGLAKNRRLIGNIADELRQAKAQFEATKKAARVFRDFEYQTLNSWSRSRRVVGKAEFISGKHNPRFVVTSLSIEAFPAAELYEQEYCARGEMENRIKEQQLYLFADRTSAETMRANQLRLWFSSIAYTLMAAVRRLGLADTEMAHARCDTIRLQLLKIGAQVRVTARKIWISLSESYPHQKLFAQIMTNLQRLTDNPAYRPST